MTILIKLARYVISVGVNPKTNVGLGVPSAGTSQLMTSQSGGSAEETQFLYPLQTLQVGLFNNYINLLW